MKKILFSTLLCWVAFLGYADEGMWMLQLLKQQKLAAMQQLGLKLQDYDIYDPDGSSLKDAVVQFGRGCTGEVVSSQGLVLTNHHCGYGQIQQHSSLEHNYLEEGFWAMTLAEELPNPGLTVTFIDRIDEVTDYVKQCLERDRAEDTEGVFYLSPSYLNRIARDKAGATFLAEHPGTEVEIKPFFDGNEYYMFTKKIYSDIRLVGAPPSTIGKFGADTDNWMWPRHTGDFSIFRIYADKEGNPAPYAADNVPLRPKRWLAISTKGVQEGDFAMLLGFPGTTNRFYTSWEVAERRDIDNAVRIRMHEVRQKAMLEAMLCDPEVKIQYASKYSGSTNGYKNAIGTNWAIDKRDFEAVKRTQQERLVEWAKQHDGTRYLAALDQIERIVTERAELRRRSWMLNEGVIRGIECATVPLGAANALAEAIDDNRPEDVEKYSAQLVVDYRKFADKDYRPDVDKKVAIALLNDYTLQIPREQQPRYLSVLYDRFNGDVPAFVEDLFSRSLFGNEENLMRFVADSTKESATLKDDPMFRFARSVKEELTLLRTQLSRFDIPFAKARRQYLEGVLAMDGNLAYFPDANLTLRLSYGQVKGYHPGDGVYYGCQSTLDGVMKKEDPDNWEFVVPERLKTLYTNKAYGAYGLPDGRMPVAFIATTHTTGGNSGSPVMNGNGELIGINFDRNWEGVGGDIEYLPDYQRSIIVDIRYVLFVIDQFAEARRLIQEMDLK